jgi:hypothetical protein
MFQRIRLRVDVLDVMITAEVLMLGGMLWVCHPLFSAS